MPIIGSDRSILTETRQRIGRDRSILTTNTRVASDRSILCATNLRLSKEISILTKTVSSEYNIEVASRGRTFGAAVFIKNLTTGVTKQIPYTDVEGIHISKKRNEPVSWTVTLDNRTRAYSPYNTGSEYYNWMFPDIWNSSGLIEKIFQIKIKTGGETWESPYLTLDDYSYGATQGAQIVLSGIDLSEYLIRENQSMASFVSRPGIIKMAKQVTLDILTAYKINNRIVEFTDYPIWKLHFQGERPLDILTRIFSIPRAVWKWDKDCFVVRDPSWKPNGPADWTYEAGTETGNPLIALDYKRSKRGLVNIVEARRTLDSVYQGADQEGNDVGSKEITFTTPLWNAYIQVECKYCYIDYVYWHNANGEIGTDPGPLSPVNKITFIVWPWATIPAGSQYYWRVIVRGMENYSDTVLGSNLFDIQYHIKVTNETSVNKYGPRPQSEPIEDPLIPNREWARTNCERKIDESGRLVETLTFDCPLNPFMEPEQTVNIVDPISMLNHYMLIENVEIDITGGDVSQQFGCTRYLQ